MNRIIIAVRGGVIQEVRADNPEGLEVIVFDVDDIKEIGITDKKIDQDWKELTEGTIEIQCERF